MAEETMVQDAPTSGEVNQSDLINDAWGDSYFNTHEKELNPDKAQAPKVEAKAVETNQAETPKAETQPDPKKAGDEVDPFEQAFLDESGKLDTAAMLGYQIPDIKDDIKLDVGKPAEAEAPKQEQWQIDRQEIETVQTQLRDNVLQPLEKAWDNILKSGLINDQLLLVKAAMDPIYNERKQLVDNHVNEMKAQKEFQRTKLIEDKLLSGSKMQEMQANAKTNTNEIISQLPGKTPEAKAALFNKVMFGDDCGAQVLNREFIRAVPDYAKMTPAQQHEEAQKFITKLQSSKADLRYVFNQAMALKYYNSRHLLAREQRLEAVAEHKQNALSAQKAPNGSSRRQAPPAGSGDYWGNYLNGHYAADRV